MPKKNNAPTTPMKKVILIFVEGQTEVEFYKHMVKHIKNTYPDKKCLEILKPINVKGVGNYSKKAISIYKNRILSEHSNTQFIIFLSYDSDRFEFSAKPPVNWPKVEKGLIECGYTNKKDIHHIIAVHCIEDWFLKDIKGLSEYLKISNCKTPKGKDGVEKIENLFKKKNKLYQKGSYTEDFLDSLDFNLLFNSLSNELTILKQCIFEETTSNK